MGTKSQMVKFEFLENELKKNNSSHDFHELTINIDGGSHASSLSTGTLLATSNVNKRVRFDRIS